MNPLTDLKPALKSYIIGLRNDKPEADSSQGSTDVKIILPSEYKYGQKEGSTEYRLVEVKAVPSDLVDKVKPGQWMLVHEIDHVPQVLPDKDGESYVAALDHLNLNLQSIPYERVMGIGDSLETMEPLRDIVFVKKDEEKDYIEINGLKIYKPDVATSLEQTGVVLKAGPRAQAKVGDKVLFYDGAGIFFNVGEHKFICLNSLPEPTPSMKDPASDTIRNGILAVLEEV